MSQDISPLKKHIQDSPRLRELKEKRRRRVVRLWILLGVLFFTIISGIIYTAKYPTLQIDIVEVSGNKVVDTSDIIKRVNDLLSGNYLYVIPHRNTFVYPKQKIINDLHISFPRLKEVSVFRMNNSTLRIVVSELRGQALWCEGNAKQINTEQSCYFTDDSGKIISSAPFYSGNVYPRFSGGQISEKENDPIGKFFTTQQQFLALIDLRLQIQNLGFQVKMIQIGPGNENTCILDLGKGKTAPIRFLSAPEYKLIISNLTAAVTKPEIVAQLKSKTKSIEYFDLRFTNKVYYKFTEADPPVKK